MSYYACHTISVLRKTFSIYGKHESVGKKKSLSMENTSQLAKKKKKKKKKREREMGKARLQKSWMTQALQIIVTIEQPS